MAATFKVKIPSLEPLPEREQAPDLPQEACEDRLAVALLRGGSWAATTAYVNEVEAGTAEPVRFSVAELAAAVRHEPQIMAQAQDYLIDAFAHPCTSDAQKTTYLQALTSLILNLDHHAFPQSEVTAMPDTIPDGFVDLGADPSQYNGLEQLLVPLDKQGLLALYQDVLMSVFQGASKYLLAERAGWIIRQVVDAVHERVPEGAGEDNSRRTALIAQVLLQTCGVKSRIVNTTQHTEQASRTEHYVNLAQLYHWNLIDATLLTQSGPTATGRLRPAVLRIGTPETLPPPGRYPFPVQHVTYDFDTAPAYGFVAGPPEEGAMRIEAYPHFSPPDESTPRSTAPVAIRPPRSDGPRHMKSRRLGLFRSR